MGRRPKTFVRRTIGRTVERMRQRVRVQAVLCMVMAMALPGLSKSEAQQATTPPEARGQPDGTAPSPPAAGEFDRRDNAIWLRRHWMHEGPTHAEIAQLVASLRARGIRRVYPFLGPMDRDGWPGWRSSAGLVRYVPERAGAFLRELHRIAPEIRVLPWTGGILNTDVRLQDEAQRRAFAEHARRLIELGADGIHLNIEPLPSWTPGYVELLRTVRMAIGDRTLSIAAYPPPTELHPFPDVHWELSFLRQVCLNADELAIMAYDTAVRSPSSFQNLVSRWIRELAATLPEPADKGCEWLMGVPTYDDDTEYHRPDVETIENSLNGIVSGLRSLKRPENFRGVAIYASFTTDARKWAVYDRLWRGIAPVASSPPDPGNTGK
jgi:hypothetical protein